MIKEVFNIFRSFNIDEREALTYELYKNRSEVLFDLPDSVIKNHVLRYREPSSFDLEIPKYIGKDKKINPLYNKVKAKQQIIVSNSHGDKERYIIEAPNNKISLNNGSKKFNCYSFEKTLERHRVTIPEGNYQLISDEVFISKGILELALEGTEWSIGYVDDKARKEMQIAPVTIPRVLFTDYEKEKVEYDQVLFECDIDTTHLKEDSPLYFTMEYNHIETYQGEKKLKTENVVNYLPPLYTQATHIKAEYVERVGNRWGVKYTITLEDGVIEEVYDTFTNITNMNIKIKDIVMKYETGQYEETDVVLFPLFNSFDDSIKSILSDIESAFNCLFVYNTYNKTIDCYSKKEYGESKGIELRLDTNVIEVNTDEEGNIPCGLKVIGKDNTSIIEENIFGTDTIYNYDYYIKEGLIPEDMILSWERYVILAESLKDEWALLKSNRELTVSKRIKLSTELSSLGKRIAYTKTLLSAYIEAKDEERQKETQAEIEKMETRFNEVSAEINQLTKDIEDYDDKMMSVNNVLDKSTAFDEQGKIFTQEHLDIFDDINEIEVVSDSYYTVPYALFKHYEEDLAERVIPIRSFDITTDDLCKYLPNWSRLITLGDIYEVDEDIKEAIQQDSVRLLEMQYDASKHMITKVVMCNKEEKVDKLRNLNNTGRKTSQAVNTNNKYTNIWEDSISSNNFVKSMRENGLTLATNTINSTSISNILDMGSHGFFIKNADNPDLQLGMTSGVLAISEDGFKTSKVAINSSGVSAEILVGKILLGEELYITTDDGGFFVGNTSDRGDGKPEDFGMVLRETGSIGSKERIFIGLETDSDGIRRAKLRITDGSGEKVVLDETGILQTSQNSDVRELDKEHPLFINWFIDEGVSRIDVAKLLVNCEKFRSTTRGGEYCGKTAVVPSKASFSSTSGGGQTTSYNGSHNHIILTNTPPTGEASGDFRTRTYFGSAGVNANYSIMMDITSTSDFGSVRTWDSEGSHSHYTDAHSHQIPSHSHPDISISHNHPEIWGITEDTVATNVDIWVNDVKVLSGGNGRFEVDIAQYMEKGWNLIEFSSDTNGAIAWNLFTKTFNKF